jgi:hypothetical protein
MIVETVSLFSGGVLDHQQISWRISVLPSPWIDVGILFFDPTKGHVCCLKWYVDVCSITIDGGKVVAMRGRPHFRHPAGQSWG